MQWGQGNSGNYITGKTNVIAGESPEFSVAGTDTNIAMNLRAKGASLVSVGDYGTGSAVAGAVTVNAQRGLVTTEALTTAALLSYTLTLTNNRVTATSVVQVSIQNGTNTQGIPILLSVAPGSGSCVITIINLAAILAMNGSLKIAFVVL